MNYRLERLACTSLSGEIKIVIGVVADALGRALPGVGAWCRERVARIGEYRISLDIDSDNSWLL